MGEIISHVEYSNKKHYLRWITMSSHWSNSSKWRTRTHLTYDAYKKLQEEWCIENLEGKISFSVRSVNFELRSDAMAFKLGFL